MALAKRSRNNSGKKTIAKVMMVTTTAAPRMVADKVLLSSTPVGKPMKRVNTVVAISETIKPRTSTIIPTMAKNRAQRTVSHRWALVSGSIVNEKSDEEFADSMCWLVSIKIEHLVQTASIRPCK